MPEITQRAELERLVETNPNLAAAVELYIRIFSLGTPVQAGLPGATITGDPTAFLTTEQVKLLDQSGVSSADLASIIDFVSVIDAGLDPEQAIAAIDIPLRPEAPGVTPEEAAVDKRAAIRQDLVTEYAAAGIPVTVDDEGRFWTTDPQTQTLSVEMDSDGFSTQPISRGEETFDPFSRSVLPFLEAFGPELPYLLDPSYEIRIDVDDYFAMLRWLDPEVKQRVDDDQRITDYFAQVDRRETAIEERGAKIAEAKESGRGPGRGGIPFGRAGFVPDVETGVPVGGIYASGDEARLFVTKSPEYISYIQGLMIQGNILTREDIARDGSWGMAEEAAIAPHLFAADRRGKSIRQWLLEVAADPLPPEQPVGFVQPVYDQPDMATFSQTVKASFRTQLGREPEPYEMGDLITQMETDHFADFQSQVDAARMEFNARQEAVETGTEQTTGRVQGVDPFARMKEAFDKKFGPERERQEDVQEHGANVALLFNTLAGLERQVEGG